MLLSTQNISQKFKNRLLSIVITLYLCLEISECNLTGIHYLPPYTFRHDFRRGTRVRIESDQVVRMHPINDQDNSIYGSNIFNQRLKDQGVILQQGGTYEFRVYPDEDEDDYEVEVYNDDGNFKHKKYILPIKIWQDSSNFFTFRITNRYNMQTCNFKLTYKSPGIQAEIFLLISQGEAFSPQTKSQNQLQFRWYHTFSQQIDEEQTRVILKSNSYFDPQNAKEYFYQFSSEDCEVQWGSANTKEVRIGEGGEEIREEEREEEEEEEEGNSVGGIVGGVAGGVGAVGVGVGGFFVWRRWRRKRRELEERRNAGQDSAPSENYPGYFANTEEYLNNDLDAKYIGKNDEKKLVNPYASSQMKSQLNSNIRVDCSICLSGNCDTVLKCTHRFHKKCILDWKKRNKMCPICRKEIAFK